jgi:hypothetical protein
VNCTLDVPIQQIGREDAPHINTPSISGRRRRSIINKDTDSSDEDHADNALQTQPLTNSGTDRFNLIVPNNSDNDGSYENGGQGCDSICGTTDVLFLKDNR